MNRVLSLLIIITFVSSCSYLTNRSDSFEDKEKKVEEKAPPTGPVPRVEYNALLSKYNELMAQSNNISKEDKVGKKLISDLNKVPLAETVDVFGDNGLANKSKKKKKIEIVYTGEVADSIIESQIRKLQKAESLLDRDKYDQALSILKEDLENSPVRQIRVKTKFLLGELLFKQNEYDLSMQIFEEVITKYAFSGLVIKTLGRLIVCSEKLKLSKKKDRYYSLLHDFFEAN